MSCETCSSELMEPTNSDEHLFEQVLSKPNLTKAWKRVKANKGKPGIDHMSIDAFPEFAKAQWTNISQALFGDRYQPSPVLRVEIPKLAGGTRPLGIPTVSDRVNQLIKQSIRFASISANNSK